MRFHCTWTSLRNNLLHLTHLILNFILIFFHFCLKETPVDSFKILFNKKEILYNSSDLRAIETDTRKGFIVPLKSSELIAARPNVRKKFNFSNKKTIRILIFLLI